jgi:alpha-N-arabinofuranosidase
LDVVAAWTADRKAFTVAVINPTDSAQAMDIKVKGVSLSKKGALYQIAPKSLTANITVGEEPEVKVDKYKLKTLPKNETFPPYSISIYRFDVR